jgi:hypothetical protein
MTKRIKTKPIERCLVTGIVVLCAALLGAMYVLSRPEYGVARKETVTINRLYAETSLVAGRYGARRVTLHYAETDRGVYRVGATDTLREGERYDVVLGLSSSILEQTRPIVAARPAVALAER